MDPAVLELACDGCRMRGRTCLAAQLDGNMPCCDRCPHSLVAAVTPNGDHP